LVPLLTERGAVGVPTKRGAGQPTPGKRSTSVPPVKRRSMDAPLKRDAPQSLEKRRTAQLPIKRGSTNLPGKRGAGELLMKRGTVESPPPGSVHLPTPDSTIFYPIKRGIVEFSGKLRTRATSDAPMKRGNGIILDIKKVRARSLEQRNPIQGFSGFWAFLMKKALDQRQVIVGLW
jgi:hypothetical protein